MMKIKKVLTLKVILLSISVLFLFVSTSYSYSDALRVPRDKETQRRMIDVIRSTPEITSQLIKDALGKLIELGKDDPNLIENCQKKLKILKWDDLQYISVGLFLDLTNNIFANQDLYTVFNEMGMYGRSSEFIESLPVSDIRKNTNRRILAKELHDLIDLAGYFCSRLYYAEKGEGEESFVDFFAKAYASYYFTHPAEDIMRRTAIPVQGIDSRDGDVLDVGTGISGIVHIRNWESGHKLVLLDESIFITKMLREFLKLTGKDNVEIVQADIANYNPERKIHHIRINSALHHLFMKGNSPIEERLLAVRQLFFQKAYSILDDGGNLVIKDRTDEFEDLQEKEFEGDPIAYVGANYNVNTRDFMITQAQHDLYAKHFKVVAYLCNSLKDNGFSVAIVQIGSAKDYVSRKPLISFTLEAKKNISHLQSDDLVDIAGEAGRKDL